MSLAAAFVRSVFDLRDLPTDGLPEVALVGRSNVGKSSLINAIAAHKGLAKTSSTPGKTKSLNFYRLEDRFYIVDTPGYGYARQSKEERRKWHILMDRYFEHRAEPQTVAMVIDSRHPGLANDLEAIDWLRQQQRRSIIILTKADKCTQRELAVHEKYLRAEFSEAESLFSVSSETGKGIIPLRRYLETTTATR
ncbi:MAG: YihA family ribosome biogenesis GTP-binding protein [Bacteroidetes bacterium]|nr:YihA family ribosome biogenesis GTP-binding protein [Bacteroidota bacterium]